MSDVASPPVASGRSHTYRSLRVRNYRLYFAGQLSSLCGTYAQAVAMSWLVLELTDSGSKVGFVTSLLFLPTVLLGGFTGTFIDRTDRRHTVVMAELVLAAQALAMTLLVATDAVQVWMVFALAAVQGVGTAFEQPARQTLLSELVGDEDLPNALSLNAALFSMSRIVGPAVSALLISVAGVELCFAVNFFSFLGIIVAVAVMRPDEFHARPRAPRAPGQFREMAGSVRRSKDIRLLFVSAAVMGLVIPVIQVVYPVMAKDVFDGGAGLYGVMTALTGIGALIGSLKLASVETPRMGRIGMLAVGLGASMVAVGLSPVVVMALIAMALIGGFQFVTSVATNATIQLSTDPKMRGRIVALYFAVSAGAQGFGAMLLGWVTEFVGARSAFAMGGLGVATMGAILILSARRRTHCAAHPIATPVSFGDG